RSHVRDHEMAELLVDVLIVEARRAPRQREIGHQLERQARGHRRGRPVGGAGVARDDRIGAARAQDQYEESRRHSHHQLTWLETSPFTVKVWLAPACHTTLV